MSFVLHIHNRTSIKDISTFSISKQALTKSNKAIFFLISFFSLNCVINTLIFVVTSMVYIEVIDGMNILAQDLRSLNEKISCFGEATS